MINESQKRIFDERKRLAAINQQDYRQRALKLYPHVCGACGREFQGKRLKELTVHHKDHNYKNNPPDGSNWELLCVYCHDYEHERHDAANASTDFNSQSKSAPSTFNMFADLDLKLSSDEEDSK